MFGYGRSLKDMVLYDAVKCYNDKRRISVISGNIYGHPSFNDGVRISIHRPTSIDNTSIRIGRYVVDINERKVDKD